jgi:hypothetical protein
MFDIDCAPCGRRYLVGTGSISSFHNTSDGPVAYVHCPKGHHLVRCFRSGSTEPVTAAA